MSQVRIAVPTSKPSMREIRPALDEALADAFPGGMLRRRWDGDTLRLTGPGAEGTVTLEDGHLVGRATLGMPASLMRDTIEEKVGAAMRRAASRMPGDR